MSHMPPKDNLTYRSDYAYGIAGLLIGLWLFFNSPAVFEPYFLSSYQGAAYWYRIFSESIFKPQNIYLAESLLMPLLAKTVGADQTIAKFQILAIFFQLSLMPVICVVFNRTIHSTLGVWLAIALVAGSFSYLTRFELGFPDPLTILLLVCALASKKRALTAFIFLAGLSHFSTAALSALCFLIIRVAYKWQKQELNWRQDAYILYGLIGSKIFLLLWNFIFKYRLNSRIEFVFEKGVEYFWDRYSLSPSSFWLTPGTTFLWVNGFFLAYLMIKKWYWVISAQLLTLTVAYISLFLTVDGLRVFAVVVACPFIYMISIVADSLTQKLAVQNADQDS